MTPTEPDLAARASTRLHELAESWAALFTDPGERTHWAWLLCALLIAAAIAWRSRGTKTRSDGEGSAASWRRWRSASSRLDFALMLVQPIASALIFVPLALSAHALASGVVTALHSSVAAPSTLAWPPALITAVFSVTLFVAWDLSRFALHWAMHRVDFLWQFHQVHHSAEVLTPITLHRVHPVESLLYKLRAVLVTGLVTGLFFVAFGERAVQWQLWGVGAIGLAFNAIGGNLRHSHVPWGWGRLEALFISPAQHQIHHGHQGSQLNFGTWLACWDRMLGSWRPSTGELPAQFGLPDADRNHNSSSLLSALFDPCVAAARSLLPRPRLGARRAASLGLLASLGLSSHARAQSPGAAPADPAPPSFDDDIPPVDLQPTPPPSPTAPPEDAPPEDAPPTEDPDAPDLDLSELDDNDPENDPDAPDLDLSDFDEEDPEVDAAGDPPSSGDEADPEAPSAPADSAGPAEKDAAPRPARTADVETDTVSIIGDAEALPRVVGSAHRIDAETLERLEQDDVHRVLELVPGVYVRGEDGFGLRPNIGLRGVDSNRSSKVTLMEDGVLLGPAPYAAPAAYYFPMTTRMVGLEVFKGPASIRHGPNTIGGAINMQTRGIPRGRAGGLDLGLGLRGYGKVHGFWGQSWRYGGFLVEGLRLQSDGFKHIDGGGETGFGKNEFMVKGRAHNSPSAATFHQVDLKLGVSTERSYETYLGLTDSDFEADPYRRYAASQEGRMQWWRTQAELSYLLIHGPLIELRTTAYRHDFSRAWRKFNAFRGGPPITEILRDGAGGQAAVFLAVLRGEEDSVGSDQTLLIGTNDRSYVSEGVQSVLHIRPHTKHVDQDIEIGARFHHDEIRRHHTEEGHTMVRGTLVPEGSEVVDTTRNRGLALAGSFYVMDEIRIIDSITVTPGARLELIGTRFRNELADTSSRNFTPVFVPGIGAHVQLIDELGVFAGVHSGFSPVAPGQPDEVEAERSINYELGLRSEWRGLRAEAAGFYNDYSNLTGECTFAQGCDDTNIGTQYNAGKVQVAGSELSGSYTHRISGRGRRPSGWITGGGNYTFTWSRFLTSFSSSSPQFGDVEAGDALPYLPMHTASAWLAGGTERFSLDASFRFTGEMRDLPGQGEIPDELRIPAYFTLDAGGRVWITRRASIYTTLSNITGNQYAVSRRPFGLRPGRPFFAMLGFKYEFE